MSERLSQAAAEAGRTMQASLREAGTLWTGITASIDTAIRRAEQFLSMRGSQQITVQLRMEGTGGGGGGSTPVATTPTRPVYTNQEGWQALADALSRVQVVLDGEAVGELITPRVDEALAQAAQRRRYG